METFLSLALLCLAGGARAQHPVSTCQDLDTHGCEAFSKAKPDLCTDPAFSQSTCKRFCGNCPLECYSCPSPVRHVDDCNTTTTCGANMTCVTRHLHAADGHHEYLLSCERKEICSDLLFGFGKRDLEDMELKETKERIEREVILNCCDTDFCNYPLTTTTTTTTPKPTTHHPTLPYIPTTHHPTTTPRQLVPTIPTTITGCNRDIVFVLDASGSVGTANFQHELDFVRQVLSQINIGPSVARVSLMTFSSKPDIQWYLNTYSTKVQVLNAINNKIPYSSGTTHTAEAIDAVIQKILIQANGDRVQADNAVVIVTDGKSNNPAATLQEAAKLKKVSMDVVTVGVGLGFSRQELEGIATNQQHVFDVHTFPNLQNIISPIVNIICS